MKLTDTQSGFRALSRKAVKSIELNEGGFAIESEMIIHASRHDLKIAEVPIYCKYHGHGSKSNPAIHGFGVLFRILILTVKSVFQRNRD